MDYEIVTCVKWPQNLRAGNFKTKWSEAAGLTNQPGEGAVFPSLVPPGEWLPGFSITSVFYHPDGNKRTHKPLLFWFRYVSPPNRKGTHIGRHKLLEKSVPEKSFLEMRGEVHKETRREKKKKKKKNRKYKVNKNNSYHLVWRRRVNCISKNRTSDTSCW